MFAAYFGHSNLVSILISSNLFDVRDKTDKGSLSIFQKLSSINNLHLFVQAPFHIVPVFCAFKRCL